MTNMKWWIMLAVSSLMNAQTTGAATGAATGGVFNPSTMTLPNGLQVVLIENHLAPIVSVNLMYKVGCADDPTDIHGISHFLEHMMFRGTKDIPRDQFKSIISSNGGNINAFTTRDSTSYTGDIAVDFLDTYLKLEADRMQNLVIDANDVEEERKVVLEERLTRFGNNPFGVAYEAVLRSIYWYNPYGINSIGYPQHIKAYTRDLTYHHYVKWYGPNNAVLIIAGDISFEALKAMVEKHFGTIPSRPCPQRMRVQEPDHEGVVISLEQENSRISQVNISWDYASPPHQGPDSKHIYPLLVLAQVLGGNDISRLQRTLIDNQKIAIGVSCNYDSNSLDPQALSISATLAPGTKLVVLKQAIEEHIRQIVEKGITDDELADAKRDILADLAFARDGNNSSVMAFTRLAVGYTIEDIEKWPHFINAVTQVQVLEAARYIFGKKPVAIMTVYPKGYKEEERQTEIEAKVKGKEMSKDMPALPQQKEADTQKSFKGGKAA
jgi:zinc protease